MSQSDKMALHYSVIANTAHRIEKVAKELEAIHKASIFNEAKAGLRKHHLEKYAKELEGLLNQTLIKHPVL